MNAKLTHVPLAVSDQDRALEYYMTKAAALPGWVP